MQEQLYPPGSTNFFAPFIRDFYTFDTKVQNLEMVADDQGQAIATSATICSSRPPTATTSRWTSRWPGRSIPSRARLLQNVGTSTDEVKEKLVRPMARTLVRDVLNELDSEAVYNSDKRFEKAEKARAGADRRARALRRASSRR